MSEEQQTAEAAENIEEKQEVVAEQFAEADAKAGPATDAPSTPGLEEIASELGWMPEDKFKGPKEKWKPAHEFIREGKNIQERQSRELKNIRETLDTVAKTSGQMFADRLAEEHAKWAAKYQSAVDNGDPDAAWQAANAIQNVQKRAELATAAPRTSPAPETEQWVAKNSRVMRDPIAAKRALEVCDSYARAGYAVPDQLASTEALIRREFPHLFDDKQPPQVNGQISRSSATAPRGKTAADMPKEARRIADDLVDRGLIPDVDAYAKNYFAALSGKA